MKIKNKTITIRTTENTIHFLEMLKTYYHEEFGTRKSQAQIIEELIYREYKEKCKNKQLKMKI